MSEQEEHTFKNEKKLDCLVEQSANCESIPGSVSQGLTGCVSALVCQAAGPGPHFSVLT